MTKVEASNVDDVSLSYAEATAAVDAAIALMEDATEGR